MERKTTPKTLESAGIDGAEDRRLFKPASPTFEAGGLAAK
jgi:hypothetical protein